MPPALLGRIQAGEVDKASLAPTSYHLAAHETVRDAAALGSNPTLALQPIGAGAAVYTLFEVRP